MVDFALLDLTLIDFASEIQQKEKHMTGFNQ